MLRIFTDTAANVPPHLLEQYHITVTSVREGADDIYADAKAINDHRAAEAEAETIEDTSAQEA